MKKADIDRTAEQLMELTLEGGSTPSIRNKVYDRVIAEFQKLDSLEAVLVSLKLSEYIAPYDPYKYKELSERMQEHIDNPNLVPGEEEPTREHDEPPGPGPEIVQAEQERKQQAREEAEAAHPKPKPKITKRPPQKTSSRKATVKTGK